eukprot:1787054-Pyramimonas_sp.AAC.1
MDAPWYGTWAKREYPDTSIPPLIASLTAHTPPITSLCNPLRPRAPRAPARQLRHFLSAPPDPIAVIHPPSRARITL